MRELAAVMIDKVIVRIRRPGGSGQKQPSESLNQAMALLADTDEMRPLLAQATKCGKTVAIEVFQSRDGQPLLIHIKKEAA